MMQRRPRFKPKPIMASAANNSIKSDAIVEKTEDIAFANEMPVENVTLQQTQESFLDDKKQYETKDENAVKVGISDGCPNSINQQLDHASLTLDSTMDYEPQYPSPVDGELKSKENIPPLIEINKERVNIVAVPEEHNDLDSGIESPISIATYVRQDSVEVSIRSTTSFSVSEQETKLAAERLADRLVKRRVAEKRKTRTTEFLDDGVSPSKMCMRDLIYFNPRDNAMTQVNKCRTLPEVVPERKKEPKPNDFIVPQLEIGPDGNIIIRESSLVAQQSVVDPEDMVIVDETNFMFDGYKTRKCKPRKWGLKEMKRFYVALSMVGTDFSLMSKLFHNRTRDEIKNKFKREEKKNGAMIDAALKVRRPLDVTLLAEHPSDDALKDEKLPRKKKTTK